MSPKFVRGGERPKPRAGTIVQVRPYELHGTPYFAVIFRFDDDPEGGGREARVSSEMIYGDPQPGDLVLVESVLNVVDRIRKQE